MRERERVRVSGYLNEARFSLSMARQARRRRRRVCAGFIACVWAAAVWSERTHTVRCCWPCCVLSRQLDYPCTVIDRRILFGSFIMYVERERAGAPMPIDLKCCWHLIHTHNAHAALAKTAASRRPGWHINHIGHAAKTAYAIQMPCIHGRMQFINHAQFSGRRLTNNNYFKNEIKLSILQTRIKWKGAAHHPG